MSRLKIGRQPLYLPAKVTDDLENELSEQSTPTYDVENRTLVFDKANNTHVMWLNGVVPLPVGTEIQLGRLPDKLGTAIVEGVRLLPGSKTTPTTLTLDCSVNWK